ncbi:prephenate dehydratase : Prephenate dehydratase OS=Singulisphaera acidiphila (strain ATCC BAA-1392 / DSM 18658 / VKM B-2454 / MOB10) GN=Sinac_1486 PE=4 SV=1: CM_2: PDT: ACT [Gemmata massiliana]|uniref:Bifunctional chorismate mutase/prephenate dehydratase n=1 Tax=Gemmata massiliana TaxID=1210884 RepID=A0A6P2CUC0_9BACT|nr:prephenate dehydratase [Gemmata massiliana]VTR91745.1 prephenate dehydratase : Prephenate dehydratase OS=Singulisphaera acidiphila (strain ATCC BAA-1392 / DSM 18658 / VKM B-2454 / MOB10) GN=Sinac_1486 PE=4 SV=1: CM_2: PDT: ACT [Gemmata massiliana]
MARSKSESNSNSAPDKGASNLAALRGQIDKLDLNILELLNKRASVAAQIGKVKEDQGGNVFSAAREEEVLTNVLDAHKGPLSTITVKAIFRELISGSRAIQKQQKIAYLGPEYSYSHLAAIQRFGEASIYNRTANIAAVFEELNRKHADFGVVPLENSTDGRVVDTLEMFMRFPDQVKICSEIRLRVRHHLLANCAQAEVRRVYSKEQALSQCRNWLAKNLPNATFHPVSSTADAARLVQTEPNIAAAVASREAAVRYNLGILAENIADSPFNETRFAVIGATDSAKTGTDKTALMFQIAHTPGALADVLTAFKQNKINLTWIESFPFREVKGEYVFFVDFDGHREDTRVKKVLAVLEDMCESVTVLGSFPLARADGE